MKKFIYVALLALGVLALVAPPAMAQEEKPFKIHGEVRVRGEYTANTTDFDKSGAVGDTTDFWPYRIRIAAEGSFAHNVSAWIEFQNADIGGGSGPVRTGFGLDTNGFGGGSQVELYQGNVTFNQIWSKNFSLRVGRQEIVAGNELLLGDLDFYAGQSHDGFVGSWNLKKVNVMVWATRPTQTNLVNLISANGSPDNNAFSGGGNTGTQNFLGGYATWTWKKDQSFDVYLMDLDTKQVSNVETVGVRWAHDVTTKDGFFWDAELAQQFGDASYAASSKAKGRAFEGWFGYNFRSGKNVHRIYGRYEEATGDDTSAGSTDFQGFIPMFGDFHNRTGHGDWFRLADASTNLGGGIGTGGLKATSVSYTGYYSDKHEFGVAYWKYKLQKNNGPGSDDLGNAIDIWYGYNYSRNVTFTASLSQLSPGDGLTGGGAAPNDNVTRLYGQARLRF